MDDMGMGGAFKDLTGQTFNYLLAQKLGSKTPGGRNRWYCLCECGNETLVATADLIRGRIKSCGCHGHDWHTKNKTTHGASDSAEYRTWSAIKQRCFNPRDAGYRNYGARGIVMCQEWVDDFSAFLAAVGKKPSPKHSLDRIDNNRGYEPGNVRWATMTQQLRNTRRNRLVSVNGEVGVMAEMAERMGITKDAIRHLAERGAKGVHFVNGPYRG